MKRPSLTKGETQFGAQMGRTNCIEEPDAAIKFNLASMSMSGDGCYDAGGAYWGCGSPTTGWMYHAYGEGPEFVNQMFVRAISREAAKALVLKAFKNATFFR